MSQTRMVALATVLAVFTGTELASRASAHGFGGIHIGGLGGLHLGGLGGMHIGGFHGGGFHGGGFHSGNFHGGNFHGGSNFHSGGMHAGSFYSNGMRAGSFSSGSVRGNGTTSLGATDVMGSTRAGLRGTVAGTSFASRYAVASSAGKLGSTNAVAGRAANATTGQAVSSGKSFAAQHASATSAAGQGSKTAVVQANHVAGGGSKSPAGGNGSKSPFDLGLNTGVLVPTHGTIVGFPWIGNSLLYYGSNGYGNSPYGFSYGGYYDLANSNAAPVADPAAAPAATASVPPPALNITLPSTGETLDFAMLGETEFRAGNFQAAMNAWRHAMLDDAKNQVLVLLYGQALFAIGKYDEAAGAIQHALRQMPDDKWGVVVNHYAELYRGNQDYTDQLRALEKARNKPETDSPAVRFLLGYHYGYLGYPKNAVAELDKTLSIVPDDTVAKQLRDMMAAKLPPAASSKESTTTPAKP